MSVLRNHLSEPENLKDSYAEYDTVDFRLSFSGRKLLLGSIRILSTIMFNNTVLPDDQEVYYDGFIGGHNFIGEILVNTNNNGLIESIQEYPRLVGINRKATNTRNTLHNSQFVSELCVPDNNSTDMILKGIQAYTYSYTLKDSLDFSINPLICLNRPVNPSNNMLSYTKTGDIIITLRLNRNDNCFYGSDAQNNPYQLKDLRLTFITVPDDGKNEPVLMRQSIDLQQGVKSTFSTITTKAPTKACSGVVLSFLQNEKVSSFDYNYYQQEQLPNITSLQFLFNDSESRFITYEIKDPIEMRERALKAIRFQDGLTMATNEQVASNDGYLIGVNFEQPLDLSMTKFTCQLTSAVTNTNPYTAYMFFLSSIAL